MIIDMHSHILPRVDHGSTSVEMSLRQIRKAKDAGVDVIVATPHFYLNKDTVEDFVIRRENGYQQLMAAVKGTDLENIRIIKAAEVTLRVDLLSMEQDELHKLCIEDTNWILLEMPFSTWTDWIYRSVYEMRARYRVKPILAHVERYPFKNVQKLLETGASAQINAAAILRLKYYFNMVKLVKNGQVQCLGSDTHLDGGMYKDFAAAYRKLKNYGPDMMEECAEMLGLHKRSQPQFNLT